jgi:hypothetical protein
MVEINRDEENEVTDIAITDTTNDNLELGSA